MIYDAKKTEKLSPELFQNPTSDFRGTPFWAWNCKLELEELTRQIDVMQKMGFGGAHMHVRTGMATTYLSEEHMDLIKGCVKKFKENGMLGWLYDEDRWPSGAAGGYVTKDPEYRARYLMFTPWSYEEMETAGEILNSTARAVRTGNGKLLAIYDIQLDEAGYLASYEKIDDPAEAKGTAWYAYMETPNPNPWYNNQTYVDTLNPKAIDRFIEVTYETYKKNVGGEFGKAIPAIFTDEPQFSHKTSLDFATDKKDITLPWTDDLPDTFRTAYGEELLEALPEVIWDLPASAPSVIRYYYHDHIAERFAASFADRCGKWCRENHLMLTGHMMSEPTLESQTAALGEAMRSYRSFGLAGVDMLCDAYEFTTVKQTASAANQYGNPGVLSELYGVTNWDFDFRGHKTQGDWQAALGVTTRVPHLAWVSMKGEAKRDYPASINYQVPWFEKYAYVEDHFARVAAAMTRGKPLVKVGVIHPVESYWLHWGPGEHTRLVRNRMDENFQSFIEWMLYGTIDFDYICESNLPGQCEVGEAPLPVGEMRYSVVVVPSMETIRSTTLDRLETFRKAGGRLIFAGDIPTLVDAIPSDRAKKLAEISECISFDKKAILSALDAERDIEIRGENGSLTENRIYRMRQDNTGKWLFVAQGKKPQNPDIPTPQKVKIRLKGAYKVTLYETLTGEIKPVAAKIANGITELSETLWEHDSRLYFLEDAVEGTEADEVKVASGKTIALPKRMAYKTSEENVMVLDMAEYALDDGDWMEEEELLRADNVLREILGWPSRMESVAQPWVVPEELYTHTAHLRFTFESDREITGAKLAIEDGDIVGLKLNGEKVENNVVGYYTDKSIMTLPLPTIHAGQNVLLVDIPYNQRSNIENAFIMGDFGVVCQGRYTKLTQKPELVSFGDLVHQGFPFYGANLTYQIPLETQGGDLEIQVPQYVGGLVSAALDGEEKGNVVYSPYKLVLKDVEAGSHTLELTIWGNRVNSFGPLHLCDPKRSWIGPNAWRSVDEAFSYEYYLKRFGITSSPSIKEI